MSPPALPPGSTVYSSPSRSDRATQSGTSSLGASWDPFIDPETGVVSYSYQVYGFATDGRGEGGGYVGPALTGKIKVRALWSGERVGVCAWEICSYCLIKLHGLKTDTRSLNKIPGIIISSD